VVQQHRVFLPPHALRHITPALAAFFQNHPTLLRYLLLVEGNVAGPVGQDTNSLPEQARLVGGQRQLVYRFFLVRIRIQVGAKAHPRPLQGADKLVLGEIAGAIEGHVLQEMC
jgi:hypothetical protein